MSDFGNPCYREDFGWSNKLAYIWIIKAHVLQSQTNKSVANLSSILIGNAFEDKPVQERPIDIIIERIEFLTSLQGLYLPLLTESS